MNPTLPIETERLVLRRPLPEDLPSFVAFCALERSKWVGGPVEYVDAWDGFVQNLGHWEMLGFGYYHAMLKETSEGVGRIGLRQTYDRPEPEIAFSIYDDKFEGKGLAYEAAVAVRAHAFETLKLPTVVSYIHPDNVRSVALAERMGAVIDPAAPLWALHKDLLIYRHVKGATP